MTKKFMGGLKGGGPKGRISRKSTLALKFKKASKALQPEKLQSSKHEN
jgi:hypothetical protein